MPIKIPKGSKFRFKEELSKSIHKHWTKVFNLPLNKNCKINKQVKNNKINQHLCLAIFSKIQASPKETCSPTLHLLCQKINQVKQIKSTYLKIIFFLIMVISLKLKNQLLFSVMGHLKHQIFSLILRIVKGFHPYLTSINLRISLQSEMDRRMMRMEIVLNSKKINQWSLINLRAKVTTIMDNK